MRVRLTCNVPLPDADARVAVLPRQVAGDARELRLVQGVAVAGVQQAGDQHLGDAEVGDEQIDALGDGLGDLRLRGGRGLAEVVGAEPDDGLGRFRFQAVADRPLPEPRDLGPEAAALVPDWGLAFRGRVPLSSRFVVMAVAPPTAKLATLSSTVTFWMKSGHTGPLEKRPWKK